MSQRTVVSIGNFDGVHLGHQAILRRARELAAPHDARVVALTFDPFPTAILRPGQAPPKLATIQERSERLRQAGADEVVVIEPTAAFLAQDAGTFLVSLVHKYHPLALVEGANFRFGKGRGGDIETLARMGPDLGFTVEVVPAEEWTLGGLATVAVSSSLLRWLVREGRVWDARQGLGRPYELAAMVTHGEQRGRQLGFPTANLDMAALEDRIIPADGVYVTAAHTPDGQRYPAAVSIGRKPTFGNMSRLVEAYLLDFTGDLYEQPLQVSFLRWIREQRPFPDAAALVHQLRLDIAHVRREWKMEAAPQAAATL